MWVCKYLCVGASKESVEINAALPEPQAVESEPMSVTQHM